MFCLCSMHKYLPRADLHTWTSRRQWPRRTDPRKSPMAVRDRGTSKIGYPTTRGPDPNLPRVERRPSFVLLVPGPGFPLLFIPTSLMSLTLWLGVNIIHYIDTKGKGKMLLFSALFEALLAFFCYGKFTRMHIYLSIFAWP